MTDHRYTNSLANILYKASGAKKKIREAPEDAAEFNVDKVKQKLGLDTEPAPDENPDAEAPPEDEPDPNFLDNMETDQEKRDQAEADLADIQMGIDNLQRDISKKLVSAKSSLHNMVGEDPDKIREQIDQWKDIVDKLSGILTAMNKLS